MLIVLLSLPQTFLFANNIQISNVSITGQNTASKYKMIQFDISWENSWRTSTEQSNWDAAWIFIKYRSKLEKKWYHAYLNNEGHTAPTGSQITPGLVVTNTSFDAVNNPAVGVFLYRSADGYGPVNYTGVQLRWNYGVNDLADYDSVEVCVFALEMVYIPTGPFKVGDGPNSNSRGHLAKGTTTEPFQITSEAAITIGNTATNELWQASTIYSAATIGGEGTLSAQFPKGYQSFYIMKYELSQYMYKEFLNKLTRTQQQSRCKAITEGRFMRNNNNYSTPQGRNGIKVMSDPGEPFPRVYGNDLNNNGLSGDPNDGQHIACNWISFYDLRAFADWSGLRPFTELEYEKACRGPLDPITNEYAWGTTKINEAGPMTSLNNLGTESETASPNANIAYGKKTTGPLRCGIFARTNSDRERAGAGYYGVMEMSGNLSEYTYSVGIGDKYDSSINNRIFNGNNHGNGMITASGDADVVGWPLAAGLKGSNWLYDGSLNHQINAHQLSARNQTSQLHLDEQWDTSGLRLGRTQP